MILRGGFRSTPMSVVALTVAGAAAVAVASDGFEAAFRINAGGRPIDVEAGHAGPLIVDWDGDGVRDLLVGEFGAGRLRIYLNKGTDAAPRFEDFSYFQTRKGLG